MVELVVSYPRLGHRATPKASHPTRRAEWYNVDSDHGSPSLRRPLAYNPHALGLSERVAMPCLHLSGACRRRARRWCVISSRPIAGWNALWWWAILRNGVAYLQR